MMLLQDGRKEYAAFAHPSVPHYPTASEKQTWRNCSIFNVVLVKTIPIALQNIRSKLTSSVLTFSEGKAVVSFLEIIEHVVVGVFIRHLMENEGKKLNNSSLPIAILLASIIIDGFYYTSQTKRQESVERQQMVRIEQEKQDKLEEKNKKALTAHLLDTCMKDALSTWVNLGKKIFQMYDECKVRGGGTCTTAEAYNEALKENEAQLQRDQNLCLERYSQ